MGLSEGKEAYAVIKSNNIVMAMEWRRSYHVYSDNRSQKL
jgi:hypothetical protein